jgi:hypothetical protein
VATEEYEVDVHKPEEINNKIPVLCEENYAAIEEETKSFVTKKKNFGCICSLLKRLYYSCTCDCLRINLKNFRICMKITLIACVIAAGSYILY